MRTSTKALLVISAITILTFLTKAFLFNEAVKGSLLIFFLVGAGLAGLRLFVNAMIKKMKGKSIAVKIGFFTVLLSLGIPFQNWFRTNVIFSMSKAFIVPSITVMVASVICMTIVYGQIGQRLRSNKLQNVDGV